MTAVRRLKFALGDSYRVSVDERLCSPGGRGYLRVRTASLKNGWRKIEGNNGLQSPVDDLYYGIKVVKD